MIAVWSLDGARGLRALNRRERLVVGATGLLCSMALHQWTPFIVGAVALSRAYGADAHATGDRRMCALFAALIVVLSLIATLPVVMPA
jgi:hypothetical protein